MTYILIGVILVFLLFEPMLPEDWDNPSDTQDMFPDLNF